MFTGYGDGLICSWKWVPKPPGMKDQKQVEMLDDPSPLFGHTNRINQMEPVHGQNIMFSCSNDCTVR